MDKNILIIGAGKLGTTLARALSENGFNLQNIVSNSFPKSFENFLPHTGKNSEINEELLNQTNVIIITVPDDQISKVVNQMDRFELKWKDKLVLHCSGCLTSKELLKLQSKRAVVGSLHPLQTFRDHFLPAGIFTDVIFAAEGDKKLIDFAKKITRLLKAKILQIKAENKILYHIAAVASSNFLIGLFDYIKQLYVKIGIDEKDMKKIILPLIKQSLKNIESENSESILTGPLQRKDFKTITKHINYLKNHQEKFLPLYSEISMYISRFILKWNNEEIEKMIKND